MCETVGGWIERSDTENGWRDEEENREANKKKKKEFGGGDLLDESQEAAPLWGFHLLCV